MTQDLDSLYDDALSEIWGNSWHPRDTQEVWKWAEENILAIPYSPLKGAFRASNSPWIKAPMGELANDKTNLIVMQAAIQSGKTLALEIMQTWIHVNDPSPFALGLNNETEAADELKNRLTPLWEACPAMEHVLPPPHRRKKDTITMNTGAPYYCFSYNNKNNLQRRSLKRVIVDEVWLMDDGNLREFEARTSAFSWQAQKILAGQAGIPGDQMDQRWEETDKAKWHTCCPKCDNLQPYEWDQFTYEDQKDDSGVYDYKLIRDTVKFNCKACGQQFSDTYANRSLLSDDQPRPGAMPFVFSECEITGEKVYDFKDPSVGARFISEAPEAPESKVGFHWTSFNMVAWADIAEEFFRAKYAMRRGDESLMRIWHQKRLATHYEGYEDTDVLEIESEGYNPDEVWESEGGLHRSNKVMLRTELEDMQEQAMIRERAAADKEKRPARDLKIFKAPLRTMGIDVQQDYQFVVVRSWSPDGSSRLMHWQRTGSFEEIERIRKKYEVLPNLVFVDSGYNAKGNSGSKDTVGVYAHCARFGYIATKGEGIKEYWDHTKKVLYNGKRVSKKVQKFFSPIKKVSIDGNRTCRLIHFSNLHVKDIFHNLKRNQNPDDGVTWDVYSDIDDYYLRSMDSEVRILDKTRFFWVPRHSSSPNHLLDCEVLCTLAALNLRLIGRDALEEED